jgi:hypothetical protein
MKIIDRKPKFGIEIFDSKHDPKFILVSLICALFLGFVFYYFSQQYYLNKAMEIESVDSLVARSLAAQKHAKNKLELVEANVSALKEKNVATDDLDQRLQNLKIVFASGKYDEMDSHILDINERVVALQDKDDALFASYSAKLINVKIKYEDYEKRGVKVATVAADIASASAVLEKKDYSDFEQRAYSTEQILEKLLTIKKAADLKAASVTVAAPVAAQSSGGVTFERKVVNTSRGGFTSDILTVDMNRTKVKTFTANENDCSADCPLKPLQSYVAENGGIAGINGTYFCPADYAQCAGTKNSFNFLVFDYKSKKYLNSDQNKFSVNPLMSFYNDGAHYYTQALGFGRDTSANGVISNYPTLVHNGGVSAGGGGGKGTRCGIGYRDKSLWAICARSATIEELGYVFQSMGATHAMNLDGGGSAALYFNGYKVGPGRQLPNAIVFTN